MDHTTITRFIRDERGATAVEYGLLITIFSIGMVTILTTLGTGLRERLITVATKFGGS